MKEIYTNINTVCSGNFYLQLHANEKRPVGNSWQHSSISLEAAIAAGGNVGILLGHASGVIDVDLDCKEAKALADIILPKPTLCFDRSSSDSGHLLYRCPNAKATKRLQGGDSAGKTTLVELRSDGAQTMIPPSTHPNGTKLRITALDEAAEPVDYEDMLKRVHLLAACAEVCQHWKAGGRHQLCLAFVGLCLKERMQSVLVTAIVERICEINGDPEIEDRLRIVSSSVGKEATNLKGFSGLAETLGHDVAQRIADRVQVFTGAVSNRNSLRTTDSNVPARFFETTNTLHLSEAVVGHALAEWLLEKAVFDIGNKGWMVWQGNHWCADKNSSLVKLAFDFVQEQEARFLHQRNHDQVVAMRAFESLRKLENIIQLAINKRAVASDVFDADPMLFATQDQWIDLNSGKATSPKPSRFVSMFSPVEFEPKATCPTFIKFLNDIFEGDEAPIAFMQRAIGYSLTGKTDEQCMFVLIGSGANGKSTLINIIGKLLGRYGTTAASQTLIANNRSSVGDDLVNLRGARLISISETEDGEALAEAKIKQMTGGDFIKARPLYGEWQVFTITGKLWLATNNLPTINGTDEGIWRRIRVIPFNRTFKAEEQDKALAQKLDAELPGILNWAIEGCLQWQREGLNPPQIVIEQVARYRSTMDSVAQFVDEECCVDAGATVSASSLYALYREWCLRSGLKAKSLAGFKHALQATGGIHQHRTSAGLQWQGIKALSAHTDIL